MKKYNKKAFTLIELLVVITLISILSIATYTPFSYYQTKQKVRNSAKIVTQTLYEARSEAIYGILHSDKALSGSLDIGVYFEKDKEYLMIFGYPFDEKNPPSDYTNEKYLLEKIKLEPGVQITSSGGLFLYKAITGSGIYDNSVSDNKINLTVGFKGSVDGPMIKEINYYTKTYISDVK